MLLNPSKLRLADELPLSHFGDQRQLINLMDFVSTFVRLHFTQSNNRVLNLLEELYITRECSTTGEERIKSNAYLFITIV